MTQTMAELVVFVSRYLAHRFVMEPPRPMRNPLTGEQIGFNPGRTLAFHNGRYETSDAEEIAFLRRHVGTDLVMLTPAEAQGLPGAAGVEVADVISTVTATDKRPREYRCEYCGAVFGDALAKGRHIRREHKDEKDAERAAAAAEGTATPVPEGS